MIDNIDELRARDGSADDDRDEQIDELLHGDDSNLDEERYPRRWQQLSDPSNKQFVVDLLRSVESVDEAVDEFVDDGSSTARNRWENAIETIIRLYDFDTDELLGEDVTEDPDPLGELLDDEEREALEGSPLLVATLYDKGLSVGEIADVLDKHEGWTRDTLIELGLIEGRTRDEQQEAFEDRRGDLGTSMTIDVDEIKEQDGVTLERAE